MIPLQLSPSHSARFASPGLPIPRPEVLVQLQHEQRGTAPAFAPMLARRPHLYALFVFRTDPLDNILAHGL